MVYTQDSQPQLSAPCQRLNNLVLGGPFSIPCMSFSIHYQAPSREYLTILVKTFHFTGNTRKVFYSDFISIFFKYFKDRKKNDGYNICLKAISSLVIIQEICFGE